MFSQIGILPLINVLIKWISSQIGPKSNWPQSNRPQVKFNHFQSKCPLGTGPWWPLYMNGIVLMHVRVHWSWGGRWICLLSLKFASYICRHWNFIGKIIDYFKPNPRLPNTILPIPFWRIPYCRLLRPIWLVNISRGFVAIVTLKTIQECCRVCNKSYFFLCLNLRQLVWYFCCISYCIQLAIHIQRSSRAGA
jgi:hypothetical protein